VADDRGRRFVSEGWTAFFAMVRRELGDEYLALVEEHLDDLRLRHGVCLSAALGRANKGRRYLLHRARQRNGTLREWWAGLFADAPPASAFDVHPRDEAGARALGELRQRGVSVAASALAQAADHVREFFGMLRAELAFYVGCLNLHDSLVDKGEPTCIPEAVAPDEGRLSCRSLYDVALALTIDGPVVGNDVDADGKALVIITGPNTGGKSTFLRSVGLAQLLMQCGMFVPAAAFAASLREGVCTHFKREEDAEMERGKFDEELSRMSDIVDHIGTRSLVLFNEPFAATNEREGSEIARQIMAALLERGVRIFCVTHMYELAHGFHERDVGQTLFLRAARQADGVRTFKLAEGEPLPTSFGDDLYRRIFGAASDIGGPGSRH
jgi:DNA mismatch repair ATPase MutS